MLMKCHEHLHASIKSKRSFVDKDIFNQNYSLDIFEQTTNTNELTKKLNNMKLLIFKQYQVDVKDMKCPFRQWEKYELMFSIVDFLVHQMLGIVVSQIKMERIFSLVRIINSCKKLCLQIKILKKLYL